MELDNAPPKRQTGTKKTSKSVEAKARVVEHTPFQEREVSVRRVPSELEQLEALVLQKETQNLKRTKTVEIDKQKANKHKTREIVRAKRLKARQAAMMRRA
jgi:hypothetical protein